MTNKLQPETVIELINQIKGKRFRFIISSTISRSIAFLARK